MLFRHGAQDGWARSWLAIPAKVVNAGGITGQAGQWSRVPFSAAGSRRTALRSLQTDFHSGWWNFCGIVAVPGLLCGWEAAPSATRDEDAKLTGEDTGYDAGWILARRIVLPQTLSSSISLGESPGETGIRTFEEYPVSNMGCPPRIA